MTTQQFGGTWTSIKLDEILFKYMDAYTTALKKTGFRLHYIDGFAGPGEWIPKTESSPDPLSGSPLLALSVQDKKFDELHLIDTNPNNIKALYDIKAQNPSRKINIYQDDVNNIIPQICHTFGPKDRAVVFLDPFGMQLKWITINAIAQTKRMDCWILCPTNAIQRNLPKKRLPSEPNAIRLDSIFGGRNHWQELYEIHGLIDPNNIQRSADTHNAVMRAYHKRLKSVFHMVSDEIYPLKDNRNLKQFHLMFAAGNKNGAPIARKIGDHIIKRANRLFP